MRARLSRGLEVFALFGLFLPVPASATDHNDPNMVNAIFPGVDPSAADMYGLMTWPKDEETLSVVLTWADAAYDRDILYEIHFDSETATNDDGDADLLDLDVFGLVTRLANIIVRRERTIRFRFGRSKVDDPSLPEYAVQLAFDNFDVEEEVVVFPVDAQTSVETAEGDAVQMFVGRRDDPFFIDLEGFFESINFGRPPGPEETWGVEDRTKVKGLLRRDEAGELVTNEFGRPQLVYNGDDDTQRGLDVHAIALEIPRHLVAGSNQPIVNIWAQTRRVEQ